MTIEERAKELREIWLNAPDDSVRDVSWEILAKHVERLLIEARIDELDKWDGGGDTGNRICELQNQLEALDAE